MTKMQLRFDGRSFVLFRNLIPFNVSTLCEFYGKDGEQMSWLKLNTAIGLISKKIQTPGPCNLMFVQSKGR